MPLTAHWRYGDSCNANCGFCFGLPEENIIERKIDEFKIIDKLVGAGFTHLCFTGGEPLLRKKELLPIIDYACTKGLKCLLDTNAAFLDDDVLVGDLTKESAKQILAKINEEDNKKKAEIEQVCHKGRIC